MGCDAVAVTSDDATRNNYLRELAWSLEGAGVELLVDPGLVEVAGPRMHIRPLMGFPLLHVEEPHFTGWRRVVKRVNDLALTTVGLLIISPLMLGIAAVIKLQDGGPVIFRQARIGRDGKPFTMLKFRSMVVDAEDRKLDLMESNEGKGGLFKLSNDPRVTRFGRFLRDFSLDELPQLFNVLAGSMSLVGPRPHLASELASDAERGEPAVAGNAGTHRTLAGQRTLQPGRRRRRPPRPPLCRKLVSHPRPADLVEDDLGRADPAWSSLGACACRLHAVLCSGESRAVLARRGARWELVQTSKRLACYAGLSLDSIQNQREVLGAQTWITWLIFRHECRRVRL